MEPRAVITTFLWTARLWPVVFVAVPLVIGYRRLRKPWAFFVFGCLSCYGVEWLIGQFSAIWQFQTLRDASIEDQLMHAILLTGAAVTTTSMVLAIAPLFWLWRVLKWTPQSQLR